MPGGAGSHGSLPSVELNVPGEHGVGSNVVEVEVVVEVDVVVEVEVVVVVLAGGLPGTQAAPTSGSMGYGLPAAVAAKQLFPEREVICFAGDGCFLMSGMELIFLPFVIKYQTHYSEWESCNSMILPLQNPMQKPKKYWA